MSPAAYPRCPACGGFVPHCVFCVEARVCPTLRTAVWGLMRNSIKIAVCRVSCHIMFIKGSRVTAWVSWAACSQSLCRRFC